jgi:uncharacterized protein
MVPLIPDSDLWTIVRVENNDSCRTYLTKRLIERKVPGHKHLIINSLSGAIDIFDDAEWDLIKGCSLMRDFASLPDDLRCFLARRGYLYFHETDDVDAFAFLMRYYRVDPAESQNSIIPTMSCNFRCTYCFEKLSLRRGSSMMSEDQIVTAQAVMKERISKGSNRLLRVFGGEPLQPQTASIIEKLFRFASDESLALQITSNGFHLLDYFPLFRQFQNVPLYVQVTLDGIERTHDSKRRHMDGIPTFDRIVRGIDTLANLPNTNITIRHNIHMEVLNDYSAVIAFVKQKGWHLRNNIQFQLSGLFPSYDDTIAVPHKPDALDIVDLYDRHISEDPELDNAHFTTTTFSSEASYLATVFNFHVPGIHTRSDCFTPRVVYCHSAIDSAKYAFSPDGLIYSCLNLIGNNEAAIGTYANGKAELFETAVARWGERTVMAIEECRDCEMAALCGGGCPAERMWRDGSLMKPDCDKTAKIVLLNRYLDKFIEHKLPLLVASHL